MVLSGSRTGITASSVIPPPVTGVRKITVRRIVAAANNGNPDFIVDFYEMYILASDGVTRCIPSSGSVFPSVQVGAFDNMFDGNPNTRCHTSVPSGGWVDEISTPVGYDLNFASDITVRSLRVTTLDSPWRLYGVRFRFYDTGGTVLSTYDDRGRVCAPPTRVPCTITKPPTA